MRSRSTLGAVGTSGASSSPPPSLTADRRRHPPRRPLSPSMPTGFVGHLRRTYELAPDFIRDAEAGRCLVSRLANSCRIRPSLHPPHRRCTPCGRARLCRRECALVGRRFDGLDSGQDFRDGPPGSSNPSGTRPSGAWKSSPRSLATRGAMSVRWRRGATAPLQNPAPSRAGLSSPIRVAEEEPTGDTLACGGTAAAGRGEPGRPVTPRRRVFGRGDPAERESSVYRQR